MLMERRDEKEKGGEGFWLDIFVWLKEEEGTRNYIVLVWFTREGRGGNNDKNRKKGE